MEKQKRWQLYLIIAVLVLTLYNILPTMFYYSHSLRAPIDEPRSEVVAESIVHRVNSLEDDSKSWLASFSKLIGVKPVSIELAQNNPGLFEVTLKSQGDAALFRRFLPRSGALIPFVPAQLQLNPDSIDESNTVLVVRNVGVHLNPSEIDELFQYTPTHGENGKIADLYREITYDRAAQIVLALAGPSRTATQTQAIVENAASTQSDEMVISLAKEIVDVEKVFGASSPITKRFYATFTQINQPKGEDQVQKLLTRIDGLKTKLNSERDSLAQEQAKSKSSGISFDPAKAQNIALLDNQKQALEVASAIIRKNTADFQKGTKPLNIESVMALIKKSGDLTNPKEERQTVALPGFDPFFNAVVIDWDANELDLTLYPDVQTIRYGEPKSEKDHYVQDRLNQSVINTVARVSRLADETANPQEDYFAVKLNKLTDTQSLLSLNLGFLASKISQQITDHLTLTWTPSHTDLGKDVYPIHSYDDFKKLKPEEQKLGLVVYAPAKYSTAPPAGFRTSSIYVIAKGLDTILQKYNDNPNSEQAKEVIKEFNQLNGLLQQYGFIGYPGTSFGLSPEYSKDYIFELNDYYGTLLMATRENFTVKGSKRFAVLDFSDVEQRILTQNKIDDRVQEDLLKWYETYNASQVDLNITNHYTVPAPTKNPFWQNFKLSAIKYFRGDDRKILKWGLDLSGGKTVRIGLRDRNNREVTDPEDLKQVVNELYTRVNKLGVAERTIRIEGNNIILEFPGSQGLSAADLVKASAMYFHLVNEKFGQYNATLAPAVNRFLQEVWNEAIVTNRKDPESINEIAYQHLGGGENLEGASLRPRSDDATLLYNQGLRLANPKTASMDGTFDDTLSSLAMMRGSESSEWNEQTNPLLIVFHNFALEGSSLENVQVGYDNSDGNMLLFGVKRSYDRGNEGSPRDDFYTWTSQFAEDKIGGTPKELYSNGKGWRMAVVLNGSVITSPSLNSSLRDSARITGRFSQREVNQLAADLKAGSLSFTPRILSEENVSPELGLEERSKGILASIVALALVVGCMIGYYRFAGLVASCAVVLNILIMWGVLQNIGAAITLPGIAGIVLTIGMAVDANVLVFERIREEFAITGRIGSAISAGYRKAFSAIIDSNITSIIAALILIQFDSGPIKGFAITLIIGIISSMFTALFMTRYFFAGWAQNPKNKSLTMSHWIQNTNFDFLGKAKAAFILSVILIVAGSYMLFSQRNTILGMDFTGGYSLNVNLEEKPDTNYRLKAVDALLENGAFVSDVQVRELSRPTQLRIQLGHSMEEKGHPFYQMGEFNADAQQFTYEYERNPRLTWVVNALEKANLQIQPSELFNLEKDWTVMSGQFSSTMRNNAILGLVIALLSILIYITFRFEFKYAVGAVIGLTHDVLITLGILALFHYLGFQVQIDLQVVGAIMTIIGYSLNDTIIVFDRIREDLKNMRKMKFYDAVNHALNITLSRTLITSGTTTLVLLTLVLLGGHSIFAFSLVMTIGVVVGTLSSLFIASPIMLYIHEKEQGNSKEIGHRAVSSKS